MVLPLPSDEALVANVARCLDAGSMIKQANSVLVEAACGVGDDREEEEEEEERLYLHLETRERVQINEAKSKRCRASPTQTTSQREQGCVEGFVWACMLAVLSLPYGRFIVDVETMCPLIVPPRQPHAAEWRPPGEDPSGPTAEGGHASC